MTQTSNQKRIIRNIEREYIKTEVSDKDNGLNHITENSNMNTNMNFNRPGTTAISSQILSNYKSRNNKSEIYKYDTDNRQNNKIISITENLENIENIPTESVKGNESAPNKINISKNNYASKSNNLSNNTNNSHTNNISNFSLDNTIRESYYQSKSQSRNTRLNSIIDKIPISTKVNIPLNKIIGFNQSTDRIPNKDRSSDVSDSTKKGFIKINLKKIKIDKKNNSFR